jgi:hypothetical protein
VEDPGRNAVLSALAFERQPIEVLDSDSGVFITCLPAVMILSTSCPAPDPESHHCWKLTLGPLRISHDLIVGSSHLQPQSTPLFVNPQFNLNAAFHPFPELRHENTSSRMVTPEQTATPSMGSPNTFSNLTMTLNSISQLNAVESTHFNVESRGSVIFLSTYDTCLHASICFVFSMCAFFFSWNSN